MITEIEFEKNYENEFEYMQSSLDQIKFLKIEDFDLEFWNNSIDEMDDKSFAIFWDNHLLPVLQYIDNNYICLMMDDYMNLDDYKILKNIINKLVKFIMDILPYDIIHDILIDHKITDVHSLNRFLENEENNIKLDINDKIDHMITIYKNTKNIVKKYIDDSTKPIVKDKYLERLEKLDSNIHKEFRYLEFYKSMVNQTDYNNLDSMIRTFYINGLSDE